MKPPMTYFGGKARIADRIAALLPPHDHYVEPFAGSLSVLLAKRPAAHETVSDVDGDLMTFWRVLRDRLPELERACALTPHARAELAASDLSCGLDDVERARRVWVKLTQGRGGTMRATGWRQFVVAGGSPHIGMPGYLQAYVGRFADVAERLAQVSLDNRPALDMIGRYGSDARTLIYADPPYPEQARRGSRYAVEMSRDAEHEDLAAALHDVRAAVVISGYHCPLYDALYAGWSMREIAATTGRADADTSSDRVEVLWSNRPFPAHQHTLFDEVML